MFSGLLLTALPLTGEGYGGWVSFFCKKEQNGTMVIRYFSVILPQNEKKSAHYGTNFKINP